MLKLLTKLLKFSLVQNKRIAVSVMYVIQLLEIV